jgi:DNA-binding IclR family transcriptional regulator
MLIVLEERGYIRIDPSSDKYSISMKLLQLAHKQPDINQIGSAATPIMGILSNNTQQSCHLVIRQANSGIVIAQIDSPSDLRFGVRLGSRIPLHNTCSGHILLGFSNASIQDFIFKNIVSKKKISKTQYLQIVTRVRQQGFESIQSQQIQGVQDIGFPIFNYTGNVVAALVVPFLSHLNDTHAVNFEKAKQLIENAAMDLSNALGYDSASGKSI